MSILLAALYVAMSVLIVLAGIVLGLVVSNILWNGNAPRYKRKGVER